MKNYFFLFSLALTTITSVAQTKNNKLILSAAPRIGFTENVSAIYGYDKAAKASLDYDIAFGWNHKFRNPWFFEIALGYYSYKQSVDVEELNIFLSNKDLSYRLQYLQARTIIGYQFQLKKPNIVISPFVGMRTMFYCPPDNSYRFDWQYVDVDRYNNSGVEAARYKVMSTGGSIWAFLLHYGVRVDIPVNSRFDFTSGVFADMGFRAFSSDAYHSEIFYSSAKEPESRAHVATNRGNAVGLQLGMSYKW